MIRKTLIFLTLLLFSSNISADEIVSKLSGKIIIEGSSSIEVHSTPLVDEKNIKKSKEKLYAVINFAENQSSFIKKKNKNRKPRTKFKGQPEEIYENFANSVVYIENEKDRGTGSGFIIKHKGLKIITNWHVVETAKEVTICLKTKDLNNVCNTDFYTGKVIKKNKKKDLAMIEVKGLPKNLKPVTFGSYKDVKVGETAFAIGHPNNLVWTFDDGRVSQKRPNWNWKYKNSKHHANTIQINVPINPGNSGGPLFNKDQKLIGVNTFTSEGENLNFAIAVDDLVEFINEVEQKDIDSKYIKKKKKGNTWIQKKSDKDKKSGISKKYPDAKEIDINENGKIDTWFLDEDKNGRYEKAIIDLDEDGIIEIVAFDENENKNFEMFFYDKDLDGNADEAEFDKDDNGTIDIIAYDFNQDGEWDKFKEVG